MSSPRKHRFMNKSRQQRRDMVRKYHTSTRFRPENKIIVTARSCKYYASVLFPDMKASEIKKYFKKRNIKRYLDVGAGFNHLIPDSFVNRMSGRGKGGVRAHCSDIIDLEDGNGHTAKRVQYQKGNLLGRMPYPSGHFDLILCNDLLYFWLDTRQQVLRCLKEVWRMLRKGGEFRVFPVFFADYHLHDEQLHKWINEHFSVRVLTPKRCPSEGMHWMKISTGEVAKGSAESGRMEAGILERLCSHTTIFTKI